VVAPFEREALTVVIKNPPFKLVETGWGEFDLGVTLHYVANKGTKEFTHALSFREPTYNSAHTLVQHQVDFAEEGLEKPVFGVSEGAG